MFKKYQTTAQVYRAGYTTVDWYSKSWYSDTGNSYKWHLKAQSINKTDDLNMFWKVFAFHTEITADIKAWDRLVIDGEDYDVQWVSNFRGLSFNVKQCLVYKAD